MTTTTTVAPNWTLPSLEGKTISLTDFKGKVVLLYFDASWNNVMKEQMPIVSKIAEKNPQLQVVGIMTDKPSKLKRIKKTLQPSFPILVGDKTTPQNYGITAFPTIVIIDQSGRIAYSHVGLQQRSKLEEVISAFLD